MSQPEPSTNPCENCREKPAHRYGQGKFCLDCASLLDHLNTAPALRPADFKDEIVYLLRDAAGNVEWISNGRWAVRRSALLRQRDPNRVLYKATESAEAFKRYCKSAGGAPRDLRDRATRIADTLYHLRDAKEVVRYVPDFDAVQLTKPWDDDFATVPYRQAGIESGNVIRLQLDYARKLYLAQCWGVPDSERDPVVDRWPDPEIVCMPAAPRRGSSRESR